MTEDTIVAMVMALPAIRAIQLEPDTKQASIKAYLGPALSEVVMSHDWGFAIDEADYPDGTVVDQSEYRLEGNKKDCRDIINVRYGTDLDLLDKKSRTDIDEWLTGRTQTAVAIWVPLEPVRGFPVIKLVGTPSTAENTIRYRYRRRNVKLSEFPDEWGFVLASAVTKRIVPEYTPVFRDDLALMADQYAVSGGEDNPAKLDPHVVLLNNKRAGLHGWS